MPPGPLPVDIDDDVLPGTPAVVDDAQQAGRLILDDADAKVFVPHCVDADAGRAEAREDGGPGGVELEGDVLCDVEFVREEAERVDVRLVGRVADGADQEEVRLLLYCRRACRLVLLQELGKRSQHQLVILLRPKLRNVEERGRALRFGRGIDGDLALDFLDGDGREDDFDWVLLFSGVLAS